MFSFTNYSVYYFTEVKYRIFYLFLNFSIICSYFIYYINFFIILLLQPLEFFNLDLNESVFLHFINQHFFSNWYDFHFLKSDVIVSDHFKDIHYMVYDHYPIFEINIQSNTFLYFYFFQYFLFLFLIPLLLYHVFLFFLAGLYDYEAKKCKKQLIFFFFFFFIFIKYLNPFFISMYFFFTFNNYYEFYNYEFDIEFDFLYFINIHILFLFFFYITIIYFFFFDNKRQFKMIWLLIFFYFSPFVWHFFFFLFFIYIKDYTYWFFFNIKKNHISSF